MQKIPITPVGYERLTKELERLIRVERPDVISAISTAREHGDLSENAEYHAARERQGFIEGRIQELQAKVNILDVIDPAKIDSQTVVFGATVLILDVDNDEKKTYTLVGEDEGDTSKGWISIRSPLGRALIGKKEADEVEVNAPGGKRVYEIISIRYKSLV